MIDKELLKILERKAKEFQYEFDENVLSSAWKAHKQFLKRYPFRENPKLIDQLTPDQLYKKGSKDYFFLWIEHKTKNLGKIFTYGGRTYPNASKKIDQFKKLLKIIIDENKRISEKIDADWEEINGFGGDKLIAKKILFLYFHDKIIPIFSTDHLEHFTKNLGFDLDKEAIKYWNKSYDKLSVGKKFELLNKLLLDVKNSSNIFKNWDNAYFAHFLYYAFPIQKFRKNIPKKVIKPLIKNGSMLFEPVDELGVAALFAKYHKELGFPYIIRISSSFPDVQALDKNGDPVNIELEYRASNFIEHQHPADECDVIVCWENDLEEEIPENFPKIISLKEYLENKF